MSHRAGRRRARVSAVLPADPVRTRNLELRFALWLLVALAVPRLLRLLYPAVWVEDDLQLESALAVSKGLRPYIDFAHAQMPLLEWAAGLYIRVFGASHVLMELLNAAAIYVTSLLVFLVGRRTVGSRAATMAALLYACHSLVFRYHVWAREYFLSALVLGALLVLLDERKATRMKVFGAAALLCAACAIKLTAVVAVAAICLFMAAGLRAPLRAAALALATAVGFAGFVAFCYWRYGEPFLFQAFLFHFLKGVTTDGAGPLYVASLLDVFGPLSLFGLWRLADRSLWNHAVGLVGAVFVSYLLFFGLLSPTAWGHNYLEVWPLVAIVAGAGAAWLFDAWRTSWLKTAGGLAVAAACLVWITPLDNEAGLRGSTYGFGFVPRRELSDLAAAIRDATAPAEEVIVPSFIAFEANRLQAIRYPENYGVMTAGDELVHSVGFLQARERLGKKGFFDLINETSDIWNRAVIRAIAPGGQVNAMIPDSTIQLLPLVDASPAALSERGFHVALQTEHFTLWLRPSSPSSVHQRTTNADHGGV